MAAKLDRIETLECTESKGVVTRIRREAIVTGLTISDDYHVLYRALEDAGVPASRTELLNNGNHTNLYLTERNVKSIDKDKATVDLIYELFYESNYVQFNDKPYDVMFPSMDTSVQQVTTNLDANGNQVILEHTWPNGEYQRQAGEFNFYQPQKTFSIEYISSNDPYPWNTVNLILGGINIGAWAGGAARTWMCTSVKFKAHEYDPDNSIYRWLYNITWQYNPDTWDATVALVDPITGKSPPDLVDGVGIKTIQRQPLVNFDFAIAGLQP